jgi:hypothetical protein
MHRTIVYRGLMAGGLLSALLGSAALGYARGVAQVRTRPIEPVVLSGSDIGFRMVGWQEDRAVGSLMVREVDAARVRTRVPSADGRHEACADEQREEDSPDDRRDDRAETAETVGEQDEHALMLRYRPA